MASMPMLGRSKSKPPEPAAVADAAAEVVEKPADLVVAPERLTLEAIDAQLAALDQRRAELRDALEKIPERESELLGMDASDQAFEELDNANKQLSRQLARLDLQERNLLAQATELRARTWDDGWRELVARYSHAVEQFFGSAGETFGLQAAINDICNESAARGYVAGPGMPFLWPPLPS